MPYKDPERAKQHKKEYNAKNKERMKLWRNMRIPDEKRVCSVCGDKTSRYFHHSRNNPENILCGKHYNKEAYENGYSEKRKAMAMEYHNKHKHEEGYQRRVKASREKHKEERYRKHHLWYILNKESLSKAKSLQRLMLIDLLSFGRFMCASCSYDGDIRALCLDHKNGDGYIDRSGERFNNSYKMIRYYLAHPDEAFEKLQVLCYNCNWIKKLESKECGDMNKWLAEREYNKFSS
jgi:hypothetical protein